MRRSVLWDSSAILALLDADDADHERAVAAARRIAAEARPSFITNYVEVETHALWCDATANLTDRLNGALGSDLES